MASEFKFDPNDPLALCKGEDEKSNKVLNDYAMMGVARSYRKLIDRYQQDNVKLTKYLSNTTAWPKDEPIPVKAPSVRLMSFNNWGKKFKWQERVEVWDALERAKERKEYEADRIAWKQRRLDFYKASFGKAIEFLQKVDTKTQTMEFSELMNTIKIISSEMRLELGENTPSILMNIDFDDPNIPLEVLEKVIQGDASAVSELLAIRSK